MKGFPVMLSLYVTISSLALLRTEVAGRCLRDLREFRQIGVGGRFVVNRDTLEGIIRDFKEHSLNSSSADFALPRGLPRADYDEDLYGEVVIGEFHFREPYTDDETGKEMDTHRRSLAVGIPFVSGEQHGLIIVLEMTDTSATTTPIYVNRGVTTLADSVYIGATPWRETITYLSGNDTIRIVKGNNGGCVGHVGEDFDVVLGKRLHFMSTHGHFDWGCDEILPENSGYCGHLEAHEGEIDEEGGNVCVVAGTSKSSRCPASMTIEEVTGELAEIFSDLMVNVPATSFEAEWIDRVHQTGIIYPCIT